MMQTGAAFSKRNFVKDNAAQVASANPKQVGPQKYSVDSKRAYRIKPGFEETSRNKYHEESSLMSRGTDDNIVGRAGAKTEQ